jgi:hypothetical protein
VLSGVSTLGVAGAAGVLSVVVVAAWVGAVAPKTSAAPQAAARAAAAPAIAFGSALGQRELHCG